MLYCGKLHYYVKCTGLFFWRCGFLKKYKNFTSLWINHACYGQRRACHVSAKLWLAGPKFSRDLCLSFLTWKEGIKIQKEEISLFSKKEQHDKKPSCVS